MKLEANKFYRTGDGRKARVLCTDAEGHYPCCGYIVDFGKTLAVTWHSDGRYETIASASNNDLISEWVDEPKTKKVTLRRAILKHPVDGRIFISSYSNEDHEESCLFIKWHDSIEVEVPVKE